MSSTDKWLAKVQCVFIPQFENSQLFEYFSIPAEEKNHRELFRVAAYDEEMCAESSKQQALKTTGQTERLDFFIIQAVTGDLVSAGQYNVRSVWNSRQM